jgi:hypothetical protein
MTVELLIPIGPLFKLIQGSQGSISAALKYVLPVHRNLLESGRGYSGTILVSVINWF